HLPPRLCDARGRGLGVLPARPRRLAREAEDAVLVAEEDQAGLHRSGAGLDADARPHRAARLVEAEARRDPLHVLGRLLALERRRGGAVGLDALEDELLVLQGDRDTVALIRVPVARDLRPLAVEVVRAALSA